MWFRQARLSAAEQDIDLDVAKACTDVPEYADGRKTWVKCKIVRRQAAREGKAADGDNIEEMIETEDVDEEEKGARDDGQQPNIQSRELVEVLRDSNVKASPTGDSRCMLQEADLPAPNEHTSASEQRLGLQATDSPTNVSMTVTTVSPTTNSSNQPSLSPSSRSTRPKQLAEAPQNPAGTSMICMAKSSTGDSREYALPKRCVPTAQENQLQAVKATTTGHLQTSIIRTPKQGTPWGQPATYTQAAAHSKARPPEDGSSVNLILILKGLVCLSILLLILYTVWLIRKVYNAKFYEAELLAQVQRYKENAIYWENVAYCYDQRINCLCPAV